MQQNVTFVNLEASKAPAGKAPLSLLFFKEAQSRSRRLCVNLSSLIMSSRLRNGRGVPEEHTWQQRLRGIDEPGWGGVLIQTQLLPAGDG